jgi:hypothetical protein
MPEENQDSEIIDLGFDVNEKDVKRPVLKDGSYPFTIAYVRGETSKNNQPMLLVGFRLAEPAQDTDGKTVSPGFTITQRYLRQPVGGLTQEMIQRRFQQIHFAAAGEGKVNTGAWVGKTVLCRVNIREAQGGYDESNEIQSVKPYHPKAA